jgi:hypothetical protein
MHQQAGTGIWYCNAMDNAQKKRYKKIAKKHNVNWEGGRRNDVEAVNQAFSASELEIKLKFLEAITLIRQADSTLNKICK